MKSRVYVRPITLNSSPYGLPFYNALGFKAVSAEQTVNGIRFTPMVFDEEKVLLTCDKGNEASRKTIISNGGVLENEIIDDVGLGECGIIQRYWILCK